MALASCIHQKFPVMETRFNCLFKKYQIKLFSLEGNIQVSFVFFPCCVLSLYSVMRRFNVEHILSDSVLPSQNVSWPVVSTCQDCNIPTSLLPVASVIPVILSWVTFGSCMPSFVIATEKKLHLGRVWPLHNHSDAPTGQDQTSEWPRSSKR